jgi:hypothetical protein
MKWVLIVLGGLAALAAVAALIGAALPQGHHATRRARFRAKPDVIFAVLSGPPDWRTGVKAFGNLPDKDGRKQWWEQDSHNQRITFELVEASPPARLVVRIADRGLPFGGTWTFDIADEPQGAALRITEDGEVYNVIFRFMARFVFGYTGSIETYLRDLGRKFGEPVEIEA